MIAFDELNALVGQDDKRRIDIDRYFDEMDLPESDKENRKAFATRFENELFTALSLLFIFLEFKTETGIETVKRTIEQSLLNAINTYTQADSELTMFASDFAENFVEVTVRNSEGLFDESGKPDESLLKKIAYFFSEVRARLNAADTANSVFNYEEYREAVESGAQYKQWNTMRDERVRKTHAEVDGVIIPIDEYFEVGAALMRYSHDMDCGHPEELVNCRCHTSYLTREEFTKISRGR